MSASESNSEYDLQIGVEADVFLIDRAYLETIIQHVLRRFDVLKASVDIAIVDDEAIAEVHKQYLGHPKITDVLSFDLSDDRQAGRYFEIIVNARQALRESGQRGHAPQAELALYIIHGLLHHLGYDDATDQQADRMHRMEDQILQENGWGKVYDHHEP